jgi:hypothetical protein
VIDKRRLPPNGTVHRRRAKAARARRLWTLVRRMTRANRYAALLSFTRVIAAVATGSSAAALANDSTRQFGAVICTSEAGGPWSVTARGTLTRTKSTNELIYVLKAGELSVTWRFVTTRQGATTGISPGFLIDRFAPQSPKSEESPRGPINAAESSSDITGRRQSLYASGEIREYSASNALALVIGSKCPAAKRALRPNSTVDHDARKSGARGSL